MTLQALRIARQPRALRRDRVLPPVPPPSRVTRESDESASLEAHFDAVPSPCFLLDESLLVRNLEILKRVEEEAGCTILVALKAVSMWSAFPLMHKYLRGATASSLNEVLLAKRELKRDVHAYAPAYSDEEFEQILPHVSHMTFNSFSQWQRFRGRVQESGLNVSCAIRINPEHKEAAVDMYDPCGTFSRLGVTRAEFRPDLLEGIEGLHFHALCGCGSEALERTLAAVEENFGAYLPQMKWVNFGGGHHITKEGYDIPRLVRLVKAFREKWDVEVILEPGEAVGWQTGWLVGTVLDVTRNGMNVAVLDVSAAAHMPDCLEMPYRPEIRGAGNPGEKAHTYRLGGVTCLAGDVIGDYSFDEPLQIGDRIVLEDMIHYTMVKTTFFNGVKHPGIAIRSTEGKLRVVRTFGYEDFRARLS